MPAFTGKTEEWDGSSWSEAADISTVRALGAASTTSATAAVFAGGNTGPKTDVTEEWTKAQNIKTITD